MKDLTPGTRVRDADRPSRTGTIITDPKVIEYPGMVPVLWDNSWRTFTDPEALVPISRS